MAEQAIFTAIPAGRLDDRLKVTVFITPKLDIGGMPAAGGTVKLGAFGAFSDWPQVVRDARWAFEVDGIGRVDAFPLDPPIVPDSAVWESLFGATRVGVADFQDFKKAVVHSYPVEEVAKAVTGLYREIAVSSPTRFPPITRGPLRGALDDLGSPADWHHERAEETHRIALKRYLAAARRNGPDRRYLDIDSIAPADRPKVSLAAAAAFYDRSDDPWSEAEATAKAPTPVAPEFHSFVSRCADYPELLRHLGLAVDVWIKNDLAIPEHTTIRVLDGFNEGALELLLAPTAARPRTHTHRTDRVWAPWTPELPEIVDGSLTIDRTDIFTLEQLDPDGSALKLTNLLGTLQRTNAELLDSAQVNNNAPSMTADASSLPALKSAGMLVARRNRAAGLVSHFDQAAGHEDNRRNNRPIVLTGHDVNRGWRIDVQDLTSGSREWLSLHRRVGEYLLVAPDEAPRRLPVQPAPDEAYLKAATTASNDTKPSADQWLHETLAGWDGWSLAVKRPGRPQREVDTVPEAEEREVAPTGFPLAVRFTVQPGSLPRLRFGRNYRVRVRAVDLSGGSIPSEQLDEAHERDLAETYQRWEPVPSPAVVPLKEYTEGESLMRMVIRSTLDVSVHDYVALERVIGLDGHQPVGDLGIVYREENERNLAAPIAGVQLAEVHGVFDEAMGGDPAAVAASFAIAARESGSYLTLAGGRVVNHIDPEGATELTGAKSQTLTQGEYIVHDTQALTLPYLPDPLARGVSFTTLPGDGGANPQTRLLRWPGDPAAWYDRQPVLLRIVEGQGAPAYEPATRTLVVSLPKATLTTVRLSSFLDDTDPVLMRVWNLIEQDQKPASAAQRETVRNGLHWMITPHSELTLVHAVEKPLEPPSIALGPGTIRLAGETFCSLIGAVHNHAMSTGRIDIDATWSDPVDDVLSPAPTAETKHAHIADFQLETSEAKALIARTGGPAGGPYGPRHRARHEFGDTRHRYVEYTPTATTRFREYFPSEITDQPELVTSIGPALSVNVPSSARPQAPDVRYIVPTWQWTTEALAVESPLAVRRVRSGGGLRVYLRRPWYSSGPDELLGVVLRIQPWLTWPVDMMRGVEGEEEAKALADVWSLKVLEHVQVERDPDQSSSAQLHANAGRIAQERSAPDVIGQPVIRSRTGDERFLLAAQRAVSAAREADVSLVAAAEVTAASTVLSEFLPLLQGTGPEGRRFTSVWGADPVFAAAPVANGPYIHQFALRTAVGSAVSIAEVAGERVTVVGHTPEFDAERRLWFCDLQLDAGSSYTPLVQLALARYQPHSVAGEEISKVVKADFVQLLPRREATFVVSPDASAAAVTLAGPVGVPEHADGHPELASRINASRVVQAWVERLPAGATSDLDWSKVDAAVTLSVRLTLWQIRNNRYDDVEWVGAVPLPERQPGEQLRLVLAEYELHRGDAIGTGSIASILRRERRLVYSDTVDLP